LHSLFEHWKEWLDLRDGKFIMRADIVLPSAFIDSLVEYDAFEDWLKNLSKATGLKGKELWMPLRLRLTGKEHGPEMIRVVKFLGRERVKELLV
jgi:glutamyl/glutaminyl-tRNA synthetase